MNNLPIIVQKMTTTNIAKRQYANSKCVIPMELIIKITTYLNADDIYEVYSKWNIWGTVFRNALILNRLYMPTEKLYLDAEHPLANTMIGDKYYIINYSRIRDIIKIIKHGKEEILMRSPYIITFDPAKNINIKNELENLSENARNIFTTLQFDILAGAKFVDFCASKYLLNNTEPITNKYLIWHDEIKYKVDQYYDLHQNIMQKFSFETHDRYWVDPYCITDDDKLPTVSVHNSNGLPWRTDYTGLYSLMDFEDDDFPQEMQMLYLKNCKNLHLNVNAKQCMFKDCKNITIKNAGKWEHAQLSNCENIEFADDITGIVALGIKYAIFKNIDIAECHLCENMYIGAIKNSEFWSCTNVNIDHVNKLWTVKEVPYSDAIESIYKNVQNMEIYDGKHRQIEFDKLASIDGEHKTYYVAK